MFILRKLIFSDFLNIIWYFVFYRPYRPLLCFTFTDVTGGRRSGSPGLRSLHRQGSVLSGFSDRMSNVSVSLSGGPASEVTAGAQPVTPQQFGVMGEWLFSYS